jgi:lipopolysaccharide/colanic/teichoic acid biosynthesis glycosyltransferase
MRVIDSALSLMGLLVLLPFFCIIALLIKLDSPGPVFYKAQRVGKDVKLFRLYKFRTMVANADKQGPGITAVGDNRITPIGRLLRRTKLDELPQLINVLQGEMSLVGPRPEDPRYVALYSPDQRQVLSVRPGITSAASLAYRHEEQLLDGPNWEQHYIQKVMPHKLRMELSYLTERSILTDLGILFQTARALLRL